jgi:gluconate 2-dehydrogenase gamma chain
MPEDTPQNPARRTWIKVALAAGAGGAAIGAGGAAMLQSNATPAAPAWQFFTEDEARLVEAVAEQIIPTDRDAGATEARVVDFIDRQLAGTYQRYQDQYRAGLRQLQAMCQQLHGLPFEQLAWEDQTAVLQKLVSGKTPEGLWQTLRSQDFFQLIRDHSMQGFYGSPRHGGNRGYVSYQMLGLEVPRVLGQNRYPEPS